MPSSSLAKWSATRAKALDEIVSAHQKVGGTAPGRRFATQQINHAYAVLLSSQFQGFCRDLHSESVDHLARAVLPSSFGPILRSTFVENRQLDKGNPVSEKIAADFKRLGILFFWKEVENLDARNVARKTALDELIKWRNAIAHQDFDPTKLGGTTTLHFSQVRAWRRACNSLAAAFDGVLRAHIQSVTGNSPW